MKHVYSVMLTEILLFAVSPLFSFVWALDDTDPLSGNCGYSANYQAEKPNLKWKVDTVARTLVITGSGEMQCYDPDDPKAPWLVWKKYIDKIVFPNGMTTVGTYSMWYLTNVKEIDWGGNTVTHIYRAAFTACTSLTQLNLPKSVETIGTSAFEGCTGLTSLVLPNSLATIDPYAFQNCTGIKTITMGDNVTEIKLRAFNNLKSLETVDFGKSPTVIGTEAFLNPVSLVTIKSKRIKSISSSGFSGCYKLVNLDLGDSLQTLWGHTFAHCESLKELHLPATLQRFYANDFLYCYSLDVIDVDARNTVYNSNGNCNAAIHTESGNLVLGCWKSKVPAGTISIGEQAFFTCKRLESITLPEGLQLIGSSAFDQCDKLKSINFPNGMQTIASYAFRNCDGLTALTFPNSLEFIGACAFTLCDGLQSVVLPEGLKTIQDGAFSSCSQLKTVTFPESVTSVGCGVFEYCNRLAKPVFNSTWFVQMPRSYKGKYTVQSPIQNIACQSFYDCDSLTEVILPTTAGTVYSGAFQNSDKLETVSLPENLTYIADLAFANCNSLNHIILPPRLHTIFEQTFYGCSSLPEIIIPDSVSEIQRQAFKDCKSLTSITFPADLTSLYPSILSGCVNLNTIIWNVRKIGYISDEKSYDPFSGIRSQITSFTFGDSVKMIPANICKNMTALTSVSLGCNIDSIVGANVFYGCNNIKSVHWNLRSCDDPEIYYNSPFYSLRNNITTFTFGDSVRHIPAYLCHSMTGLRRLHIPKNVRTIGSFAFRYVNALDSISVDGKNPDYDSRENCNALIDTKSGELLLGCWKTKFPNDITGIGDCAFRNVLRLDDVRLPEGVTYVSTEAFNGCHDLKKVSLPESLTLIDAYAFQDCDSLTTLSLPAGLEEVGLRAFAHCSGLDTVWCNGTEPAAIEETSFSDTHCLFVTPCDAVAAYRAAPVWSGFGTRLAGDYPLTLTVGQNDIRMGHAVVVQKPDCEHDAIVDAEPAKGFGFVEWQDMDGSVLSRERRYEFPIDSDTSIRAVFERVADGIEDVLLSGLRIEDRFIRFVSGYEGSIALYDMLGNKVDGGVVTFGEEVELEAPIAGVYTVVIGNESQKVVIR